MTYILESSLSMATNYIIISCSDGSPRTIVSDRYNTKFDAVRYMYLCRVRMDQN